MIEGVKIRDLVRHVDERGSFTELIRGDWNDLLGVDKILQINLSYSYPGIIRAWHRHLRGQVDYFLCLQGAIKVCAYDERSGSPTEGELDEIILSEERLRVARIPGILWHGYKAVGIKPVLVLYGVTKLFDYESPDEERRPWIDATIVPKAINGRSDDPRVGEPWDWNRPPHK